MGELGQLGNANSSRAYLAGCEVADTGPSQGKPTPHGIPAKLRDHFAGTSERAIRDLESHIGHQLPGDYRGFLLKTNGGVFHDYAVIGEVSVSDILAVDAGYDWADLKWNCDASRDWLPSNLLPVASNAGGESFVLKLDSPHRGRICLLDSNNDMKNLPVVAASFTDFINGIVLDPRALNDDKIADAAFDAVDRDDIDGLRLQLNNGLPVDHRGEREETLLMHAAWKCRLEIMELLLERGASINAVDDRGHRPVFFAVFTHSPDALQLLIQNGGNPNDTNKDGQSVLMRAVDNASTRCVKELIRLGANVNYTSPDGKTVLQCCWDKDLKPLLVQAGAK